MRVVSCIQTTLLFCIQDTPSARARLALTGIWCSRARAVLLTRSIINVLATEIAYSARLLNVARDGEPREQSASYQNSLGSGLKADCMQDTFARATHSAGRPSETIGYLVYNKAECAREQRYLAYNLLLHMQPIFGAN